jgi:hypothetical protein
MVNIIMDAMMNPIKLDWKTADYAATATTFRPDQVNSSTQTEHRKTLDGLPEVEICIFSMMMMDNTDSRQAKIRAATQQIDKLCAKEVRHGDKISSWRHADNIHISEGRTLMSGTANFSPGYYNAAGVSVRCVPIIDCLLTCRYSNCLSASRFRRPHPAGWTKWHKLSPSLTLCCS